VDNRKPLIVKTITFPGRYHQIDQQSRRTPDSSSGRLSGSIEAELSLLANLQSNSWQSREKANAWQRYIHTYETSPSRMQMQIDSDGNDVVAFKRVYRIELRG
jgi:hypothetical protein